MPDSGMPAKPGEGSLSARQLYEHGRLIEAARKEATACDRDGYDITAAILRDLADAVEKGGAHG